MIEGLIALGVVICFVIIGANRDETADDDKSTYQQMKHTKEELEQKRKELEAK